MARRNKPTIDDELIDKLVEGHEHNAALLGAEDHDDDLQRDKEHELSHQKNQAVLGVPLHLGVLFFHQQWYEGEDPEVGEHHHDGAVVAGGRRCRSCWPPRPLSYSPTSRCAIPAI